MDRRSFIRLAADGTDALALSKYLIAGQAIAAARIDKIVRNDAGWR